MIRSLLLAFALAVSCASADEAPAIPDKANRTYQAAVADLVKKYDAQIARLISDLDKIKGDEMKATRLEGALAIEQMIKDIKEDRILREIIAQREVIRDPDILIKRMSGHWTWRSDTGASETFELLADGSYTFGGGQKGVWTLKDGVISLSAPSSHHDIVGKMSGPDAFEAINRLGGNGALHFTRTP